MSSNNDPLSRKEFADFANTLLTALEAAFKESAKGFENIAKDFTYINKRLDDIDRRLELVEIRTSETSDDVSGIKEGIDDMRGDVHEMKSHLRFVPQAIDMFESDGDELADLRARVADLEKQSGED